ncbi:MAG: SiaC family regulatory phosphoprotein [Bacteroidota bacterium]|nr:SiaC family regulatory phosphoprotein [Bacteroidota bacterium]
MVKSKLHILPTDNTPEFIFNPDGIIKIKGRALVVNKTDVPEDIMSWINEYLSDPADITRVIVAFEYLNSFSTTILATIFRKIVQVIFLDKKFVIQWYYEEGDEDILERGEYISAVHDIPIEFIMTKNINSC